MAIIGDPHIFPFNGPQFDFMGENGQWYNFLDHKCMVINGRIKGYNFTVLDEVAIAIVNDKIRVVTDSSTDGFYVLLNGVYIGHKSRLEFHNFWIETSPTEVVVSTQEFRCIMVRCTDPNHVKNGILHIDMRIRPRTTIVGPIHGVVGQSADPNFKKLEGEEPDYKVSDPFARDYKYRIPDPS